MCLLCARRGARRIYILYYIKLISILVQTWRNADTSLTQTLFSGVVVYATIRNAAYIVTVFAKVSQSVACHPNGCIRGCGGLEKSLPRPPYPISRGWYGRKMWRGFFG